MKRVTGIGGIFFKAKDPEKLYRWYEKQLGIIREPHGQGAVFRWREGKNSRPGATAWAAFPKNTRYFRPSRASFMINYRVANLDVLLRQLRKAGVWIDGKREEGDYGRFAWIMDPEGNRIELWEPPGKSRR